MDITTIIILVIAFILILYVIAVYNGIIKAKNATLRAWSDIIAQERQKNKIIPNLEKIVEDSKTFEHGLLTKVTSLRSALDELNPNILNTAKLAEVERQTKQVMDGLKITVEAYPDIKTTGLMQGLMREISEQQENVGAAIRIFNSNVEHFNNNISVFPNMFINKSFNKEILLERFDDSEAAEGIEFKPNF